MNIHALARVVHGLCFLGVAQNCFACVDKSGVELIDTVAGKGFVVRTDPDHPQSPPAEMIRVAFSVSNRVVADLQRKWKRRRFEFAFPGTIPARAAIRAWRRQNGDIGVSKNIKQDLFYIFLSPNG